MPAMPPAVPTDGAPSAPDRMPPLAETGWSDAQRQAVQELCAGPRGGLRGPFVPLLRSPELLNRSQRLGEYLRYHAAVPERLREFAILIAARHWRQGYEWQVHVPFAIRAGLAPGLVAALGAGDALPGLADDESVIFGFCTELLRTQAVSDANYARALALLGEAGVVDLCAVLGYYALLAMVLNVARTPVPAGPQLPFAPAAGQ